MRFSFFFVLVFLASSVFAGPTHWGSGYPYLAVIEANGKQTRLAVYEPPLRAKNGDWMLRWTDSSPIYQQSIPNGITIGNYKNGEFGTEYLAVFTLNNKKMELTLLEAPEVFSTSPWKTVLTAPVEQMQPRYVASGDLLSSKNDQIIVLDTSSRTLKLQIIEVNLTASPYLKIAKSIPIAPDFLKGEILGMAVGDFWGDGKDKIAFLTTNTATKVSEIKYCEINDNKLSLITTHQFEKPILTPNPFFTAADFVKDDFDVLTVNTNNSNSFSVLSAPKKNASDPTPEGPTYTGKALSRQWLPGIGGGKAIETMQGNVESLSKKSTWKPKMVTAGRIFGYVNSSLNSQVRKTNGYNAAPDAEIAYMQRFPLYSTFAGAPNFGFPSKDETFGYEIAIKNNGQTPIAAGTILKVWINTPYRNADVLPETCDKPDFTFTIKEEIPPFDPLNPKYVTFKPTSKWIYNLIPCSPNATWKKLNLYEKGERWVVAALTAKNDRTLRNNRADAAVHSYTYHPIFKENANLANRIPTVAGDPCSLEYLATKMADAISCSWERSSTADNKDVLQRAYFDGYEVGFPDDKKNDADRMKAWHDVQDKWEGWREIDIWWGENQSWEKYDWTYSAELHESGHLFHPLGDLYGNYVMPVWTGVATMADGSPVQIRTNLWGHDLFGSGHALLGPAACELMYKYIVGSRGVGLGSWWTVTPHTMYVRILDRNGAPVPNAEVTMWAYGQSKPITVGKTNAEGKWDVTSVFGKLSELDSLGIRHYYGYQNNGLTDANAHIFTVKIGNYQSAAVWGSEDVNSHSRLTLLNQAMLNENEWTWDFKTNYSPKAPDPDFKLISAVKGSEVEIAITGKPGTYKLYRSWEPAYIRKAIGEYTTATNSLTIKEDLAEKDGYGGNRFRAIYEVTYMDNKQESLPKTIAVCGLTNSRGVSGMANGKLIVATNSGIANPFGVVFTGTTSYQELFYHYRFGHTATKITQSKINHGKYFITLASSDTYPDDYRFDIAVPPSQGWEGYDVRNELGEFWATSFTSTAPYTLTLKNAESARLLNVNDGIQVGEDYVKITKIDGLTLTTEQAIFKQGQTDMRFTANRYAGRVGSNALARELQNPRGIDTIKLNNEEYIVIADTGNHRITVWDSNTKYITSVDNADFMPCAIAADPSTDNRFYAIDRQSSGKSQIYLYEFDGQTLKVVNGYPQVIPVSLSDGEFPELGLTAIKAPSTGEVLLAVTVGKTAAVYEYTIQTGALKLLSKYEKPIGAYAGKETLEYPMDCAYSIVDGVVQLFVLDNGDRLVRVK